MKLSKDVVEFSRKHVERYWDSDFFPTRAEFQSLWANWPLVLEYLTETEIGDLPVCTPRTVAAPRPDHSYRVVHQLDPLDTLVYTALAATVAPEVESRRVESGERVACSYRIQVDGAQGNFFANGNGFADFTDQSRALAAQFGWVLLTDISDFYNQIYVHRLQNSLEAAGPTSKAVADDVEDFLTRLNAKVSQGVPVGPAASVVMSEAVLSDIDGFLINGNVKHTRYVDDFRVFGSSRRELEQLLRELTLYLYSNHRLSLAPTKTRILESTEFLATRLDDPEEAEHQEIHAELREIVSVYDMPDPNDAISDAAVEPNPDETEDRAARLARLMERICKMERLDLGLARHVLRTCRRYRLRAIASLLLENFDFFAPVLSDVVLYLGRIANRKFLETNAETIWAICNDTDISNSDFGRMWLAEFLVRTKELLKQGRFKRWVYNSGIFAAASSTAIECVDVAWVRALKPKVHELGSWDRRDLIRASVVLPPDERQPWLESLRRNPLTPLEQWVISATIGR